MMFLMLIVNMFLLLLIVNFLFFFNAIDYPFCMVVIIYSNKTKGSKELVSRDNIPQIV